MKEMEDVSKKKLKRKCVCGKPGAERIDNGLKAGIHCERCWEKLISSCKSRSY